MPITFVAERGRGTSTAVGTLAQLRINVTGTVAVGRLLTFRIVAANSAVGGAARGVNDVNDSRNNVYVRDAYQHLNDPGAVDAGVSVFLYHTVVTTALQAGDQVWVTWSSGPSNHGAVIEEWDGIESATITADSATATTSTTAVTFATSITPQQPGDLILFHIGWMNAANDTFTGDSDTTSGSWVNSAQLKQGAWHDELQYKIVTATSLQAHQATLGAASPSVTSVMRFSPKWNIGAGAPVGTAYDASCTVRSTPDTALGTGAMQQGGATVPTVQWVANRMMSQGGGTQAGGSMTGAQNIAVGNVLIMRATWTNNTTNGDGPRLNYIVDQRNNQWVRAGTCIYNPSGVNSGVISQLWYCVVTNQYLTNDSVIVRWDQSITNFDMLIDEWRGLDPANMPAPDSCPGVGATDVVSASVPIQPAQVGDMLMAFVGWRGVGTNVFTPDADTTDGPWQSIAQHGSTVRNDCQFKVVNGTTQQTYQGGFPSATPSTVIAIPFSHQPQGGTAQGTGTAYNTLSARWANTPSGTAYNAFAGNRYIPVVVGSSDRVAVANNAAFGAKPAVVITTSAAGQAFAPTINIVTPNTNIPAPTALGSVIANNATISIRIDDTAPAGLASATSAASNASLSTSCAALAGSATAGGTAYAPGLAQTASAAATAAAATGSAYTAAQAISATTGAATGTAAASAASVSSSKSVTPTSGAATGAANSATTKASGNAQPTTATASGAALQPNIASGSNILAQAQTATVTRVATNATITATGTATPLEASATGAALNAGVSTRASATTAVGTAAANNAAPTTASVTNVTAGTRTASGTAYGATVSTTASALAQAATATALAYLTSRAVKATSAQATASGAAQAATIRVETFITIGWWNGFDVLDMQWGAEDVTDFILTGA